MSLVDFAATKTPRWRQVPEPTASAPPREERATLLSAIRINATDYSMLLKPDIGLQTNSTFSHIITAGVAIQGTDRKSEPSIPLSKDAAFAALPPLARIMFLAKNNKKDLAFWAISLAASLYMVFRSIGVLFPTFSPMLSLAHAQGPASTGAPIVVTYRDAFDWYIGGLMGLALLGSMIGAFLATDERKVGFGKDIAKTLVGFIVGFLSGGKGVRA